MFTGVGQVHCRPIGTSSNFTLHEADELSHLMNVENLDPSGKSLKQLDCRRDLGMTGPVTFSFCLKPKENIIPVWLACCFPFEVGPQPNIFCRNRFRNISYGQSILIRAWDSADRNEFFFVEFVDRRGGQLRLHSCHTSLLHTRYSQYHHVSYKLSFSLRLDSFDST